MNENFCQSCGMPMTDSGHFGTEADGSPSADYCVYCYKEGKFTTETTMDGMIQQCLEFLGEFNDQAEKSLSREEARDRMKEFFPTLKRWKKS